MGSFNFERKFINPQKYPWGYRILSIPTQGLLLHQDATSITGLNHGDLISSWGDLSPENIAATQETQAAQPQYLTDYQNGNPVVHFASDKRLQLDRNPFDGLDVFHSFFVLRADSLASRRSWLHNWGLTNHNILFRADSANLQVYVHTTSQYGGNMGLTIAAEETFLFECVYNGTNIFGWKNGESGTGNVSASGTLRDNSGGPYVGGGNSSSGNDWLGPIGEQLVYNRVLMEEERTVVSELLIGKWGI